MDRRMLLCQVASKPEANKASSLAHGKSLIMVYFVTLDHDVLVQHIADINPSCDTLLAAKTPYLYFNAQVQLA
ncbi:hypothetical protein D918_09217 [Trichuris suis]|nr:hypothetical protein D918_09217 [Trichuris suis]